MCDKKISMNRYDIANSKIPYDIENKVEKYHWWFVGRKKLLKSLLFSLKLQKNSITLDIGCGTGANLNTLELEGLYPIGLDQSIYAINLVREKYNYPLLVADVNKIPLKNKSIGLIIAMDIFEHLEDDSNGINESYRVLKEDGLLFLTVPAFKFLWGIQDKVTGHKRRYTKKDIMKKLEAAGFNILKSSYFNFFLFLPILFTRWGIHFLNLKIASENEINFPPLNLLFKAIFSSEVSILKYISFPFGTSIFCIGRKSETI